MSDHDTVCKNCGLSTDVGTHYSFLYGYIIGTTVDHPYPTKTVTTTTYSLKPSEKVFLCNKCVSLYTARRVDNIFKKALFVTFVLLVLSIIISILTDNTYYSLPVTLLLFGGPIGFVQHNSLKAKERMPIQIYAVHSQNPQYKGHKPEDVPLIMAYNGEHLAIEVTKPIWKEAGVHKCFTHKEAGI